MSVIIIRQLYIHEYTLYIDKTENEKCRNKNVKTTKKNRNQIERDDFHRANFFPVFAYGAFVRV